LYTVCIFFCCFHFLNDLKGLKICFFVSLFSRRLSLKSYFSKEKTVKKKVKKAVVKHGRENYKSRRVAAAQQGHYAFVRTG